MNPYSVSVLMIMADAYGGRPGQLSDLIFIVKKHTEIIHYTKCSNVGRDFLGHMITPNRLSSYYADSQSHG